MDGFLLPCQHAGRCQVADAWDHGALHDGSTLVILDEAHPFDSIQRDLLSEALLFEVADGVVVGVGQEVFHIRGRFDIVLRIVRELDDADK